MNIAILGAGAWGTALAIALAEKHRVALWARSPAHAAELSATRINARYLPEVPLPTAVAVTSEPAGALRGVELVVVATPAGALRETLAIMHGAASVPLIVLACKGFERHSALLPHQIVGQQLGTSARCAALSGPSFALEVARGLPTAVTLSAADEGLAREAARELHQSTLRVYFTTDVIGVAIGGAVKNVMAIAAGICDGLGLGLNARAALITRGLAEIARLGVKLGGRSETFMGLAGAGDLILTCTGDLSRNRRVGLALAEGRALEDILRDLGHVAEGVHSAREVRRIAGEQSVEMPITQAICEVLFQGMPARAAVQRLLARDPREEGY
ncbi:MAG: NAD(P)-dependent glycerol-3-phosphate dehydrogenase [Betaproteobacteria bacterium]|nr:NAD(P)-dependent glycerol-3-phosphate dehydrogenase [Betaproteobacteria bacterium]MBI2959825.1 NAD(P)-dependent glycerol-3-phosphate dehydrogenase [Betaproteobacteria bacterium]